MEAHKNATRNRRSSHAKHTTQKGSRSKNENRQYRGLTCANCRARKMRCGGDQPRCKTCEIHNAECRYDKTPPMSQIIAMAQRLQETEDIIASFRVQQNSSAYESSSPHSIATLAGPPASDTAAEELTGSPISERPTNLPMPYSRQPKHHLPNISVDENGEIQYYGPTSAVHDPPQHQLPSPASQICSAPSGTGSITEIKAHGQESKIWEDFAIGNASLQTGIPHQTLVKLLHLHWTWVSPMFMYVYRPGDMATGGRYYSEFLLTVICAHAAKYQDSSCAEFLLTRMYRLLSAAIQQPSSIPTVQALLQLSAREIAHGSISQAWIYSGIAFRMASDLGLQHSNPNVQSISSIDSEIRTRLSWSCYFWDKAISLYTGRLPAFIEALPLSTLDHFDSSMELEMWSPYYGDTVDFVKATQNRYAPQTSHAVSCFANSCKLSIIINDIVHQLYSRRSRAITESALQNIKVQLDVWRAESPAHLRFEPNFLPAISPPPYIISQNLLYYATLILAHRPFWSVPAHYESCITAAQSMEKLVLLLDATFGLENITYLMGYCIYTGASAVLEDAKRSNQGGALPILRTFIRALNAGMRRCPLLQRSLNIIMRSLNHVSTEQPHLLPGSVQHHSQGSSQIPGDTSSVNLNPYIPAFPYLDLETSLDFSMNSQVGDMGMISTGTLDCFPEMWLDGGDVMSL